MSIDFSSKSSKELVCEIKNLILKENENLGLQIIYLIYILKRKIFLQLGYSSLAEFCRKDLGLTENQSWKRSQVAHLSCIHTEFPLMIKTGEVKISYLAMAASKITRANKKKIIEVLKTNSRIKIEDLLSRIDENGDINEGNLEETIEIKIKCSPEIAEKFKKAVGLERQNKSGLSKGEAMDEILEVYLDKYDPLRKAQRAEERQNNLKHSKIKKEKPSPTSAEKAKVEKNSRYIPAQIRHKVMARSGGRCEYIGANGKRCDCQKYLEIDHIKPWSIGGGHELSNLRVLCSQHNKYLAEKMIL